MSLGVGSSGTTADRTVEETLLTPLEAFVSFPRKEWSRSPGHDRVAAREERSAVAKNGAPATREWRMAAVKESVPSICVRDNCGSMPRRTEWMKSLVRLTSFVRELDVTSGDSAGLQGAPAAHGRTSRSG